MSLLEIKDLHVSVEDKPILKGVSLTLEAGKVHALMGPNGSGKSTLANVLMGHPKYTIDSGKIFLNGEDITELEPNERAKAGLFLSFQYPLEISGLSITHFLRTAVNELRGEGNKMSILEFKRLLTEKMDLLGMDKKFLDRYLNDGFSGGEKKRCEILQMLLLDPKVAILDETDSGTDVDVLRTLGENIAKYMKPEKSVLLITHYKRILEYVNPDKLFVLIDGKIALEGDSSLVDELESKGYGWISQDE